jgi:hypothetical protein
VRKQIQKDGLCAQTRFQIFAEKEKGARLFETTQTIDV